ncbi:MAG: DUF4160 domain-containing protein [Erysipelotrichaceae bacterium]|nr:DUF4160 domain-containing protein [Erysipelotrichaceae bacterium]
MATDRRFIYAGIPHIHAIYGDNMAAISIKTGEILEGHLPPKAIALVLEWIGIHKDELLKMWETQKFKAISPLD